MRCGPLIRGVCGGAARDGGLGLSVMSHSRNLIVCNKREVHFVGTRKEWQSL